MIEIFNMMLHAREASAQSNCLKRKVGVCIPLYGGEETRWGANQSGLACTICERDTCPALHAEVNAILKAIYEQEERAIDTLYIWAEVSCRACLSFIKRYSTVRTIYCLSPESYFTEYPVIARRSEEIRQRKIYAAALGIEIIELDREEIIEHELSKHNRGDV